MVDRWEYLRDLQKRYEGVKPWEMPKEYWDGLNEFCRQSKEYTDANPLGENAPKNPRAGEIKQGTTEFDVFNALSLKRLKKNGIHG